MDLWTTIGGLALIIGIVAGIAQVLDYLEKRFQEWFDEIIASARKAHEESQETTDAGTPQRV